MTESAVEVIVVKQGPGKLKFLFQSLVGMRFGSLGYLVCYFPLIFIILLNLIFILGNLYSFIPKHAFGGIKLNNDM